MRRRRVLLAGMAGLAAGLLVTGSLTVLPARAHHKPGHCKPTCPPSPSPSPSPTPSPQPFTDPVVAAAGDISCPQAADGGTSCRDQATSDLLVRAGVTNVLPLGDAQYESGELANFNDYYHPTWGRVKSITHPTAGNHEYQTPGAAGYYDYFGAVAGDRSKGYYSFDIGTWHSIALNSNCSQVGGCGSGSPQELWLRADLAAHTNTCTLAYWHHPRFSSGDTHGSDTEYTAFWQALYDFNADVVLVGHEHNYERFAPQTPNGVFDATRGIRQFVVGTGGKSHYGFGSPIANSEVRNSDTFGVLRLALHTNGYDWKFLPEAGKSFTDSGTGSCH